MKTTAIVPGRCRFNEADGRPFSLEYNEPYPSQGGTLARARELFVAGSGLPVRWQPKSRFAVLETGFGLGGNFLATWDAWRRDPQRCAQLHFLSVERHPLTRADLSRVHQASPLRELADALIAAWPPLTPNLHRLSFDGGQVQLLLALGDVAAWLPEWVAQVDAFFLDGFSPARNPQMWQPRLFKAMARLAVPGATVVASTAELAVRAGLKTAGFDVQPTDADDGQRDITRARFAPVFQSRRAGAPNRSTALVSVSGAASGAAPASSSTSARMPDLRRAVIVGAGLAGCAAAWALAEQGWQSHLIDLHESPAQEASGNPGGLFHGIVNPQDGAHARFNRAASMEARRIVQQAISEYGVKGSVNGMLRLEPAAREAALMQHQLTRLGLPAEYVQALNAEQASLRCGLTVQHPAWFYPGGGWVDPGGLAHSLLASAGAAAAYRGTTRVHAIRRVASGWELRDQGNAVIDIAQTLVLANAFDAMRLLGYPAWPVERVRGQISLWPTDGGLALPNIPIAGAGYLLPQVGPYAVFGATSQAGDDDPAVRHSDHLKNQSQLAKLTGASAGHMRAEDLRGRTAWRMVSRDRMPIIGAVPDAACSVAPAASGPPGASVARRLDHPRFVPRLPGLFVFTALGSRGITWCALGAQVLASTITGAPQPLEASLLDAIDPARFISRSVRRPSGNA